MTDREYRDKHFFRAGRDFELHNVLALLAEKEDEWDRHGGCHAEFVGLREAMDIVKARMRKLDQDRRATE